MTNIFTSKVLKEFVRKNPELDEVLKQVEMKLEPNLRPPFEMLIQSIVYQQLTAKAAKTIYERLISLIGDLTTSSILSRSQEELRSVGLSRQKASYLHNVAEAFKSGGILEDFCTLESLETMSSKKIIQLFSQIKGVGPWTVEMYLIFSLGRLDVLSVGDLGVRKGVQLMYDLDEVPKQKEVLEITKNWHPLETVGTYLAWRVVELEK